MERGHEDITIEWFDASGGLLARTTYPLQKMSHASWVFVPTPDDPVFAILTPPILEHAIAAVGEVTAPADTLVAELNAGGPPPREDDVITRLAAIKQICNARTRAIEREVVNARAPHHAFALPPAASQSLLTRSSTARACIVPL